MPIVPSFAPSQVQGFPSKVTIADTSTGSDVAVTQRRVYLAKQDGTFLVPAGTPAGQQYINWAYPSPATITIDALDKDYALIITVQYLDVNNNILYASNQLTGLTLYNKAFNYQITQNLSSNPILSGDNNLWKINGDMRRYRDSGDDAISMATDQSGAQICYDTATNLRVNSSYYFNTNA